MIPSSACRPCLQHDRPSLAARPETSTSSYTTHRDTTELFGFNEDQFRRIKASYLGPDTDDPYLVLGLSHEATFEDVRAAYRRLMLENHPDTAASVKSAPREYEPVANEKAAAITTAYARIRADRGFLTRAD